jgi:hypothetical protein
VNGGAHLCAPPLPQDGGGPGPPEAALRPPRWTSIRTLVAAHMRPASALAPTAADAKLRGDEYFATTTTGPPPDLGGHDLTSLELDVRLDSSSGSRPAPDLAAFPRQQGYHR